MDSDQQALLARIERVELDFGAGAQAFVARLARENGWSQRYAHRAIDEYRRFAFLCVVAGHECTPSDQVDQVWHLHLLHTRAYWEHFCKQVLRQPLHHGPTQSTELDHARFRAQYAQTLASYRTWFGSEPPADVWPGVERRFAGRPLRIERDAVWIVPKPRGWWPALLATLSLSLSLGGCAAMHAIPPFSLPGSSFLLFYALAWCASLMAMGLWRAALVVAAPDDQPGRAVSDYEVAYLAGGPQATLDAVVADLVEHRWLRFDRTTRRLHTRESASHAEDPLESAVLDRCASRDGTKLAALRKHAAEDMRPLARRLEQAGLLFPHTFTRTWRGLALLLLAIGVIKLAVGLVFGKPVGFLFFACLFGLFIAARALTALPMRTPIGDALLADTRARALALRNGESSLGPLPIALGVGLFGAGVLASGNALAHELRPRDWSAAKGGGGGGCSGGGDGGGGCGGGGCGGCGGE